MSNLPPARILDVTPAEYHKLPGFSASLAKILVNRSAEVAHDAYERKLEALEGALEDDGEVSDEKQARLDRGNILHALVLGKGGERIEVIDVEKYTTKDSRMTRDAARRDGRIPVKKAKMEIFEAIAAAIRGRIAAAGHELDGTSELAIAWTEETPHGPVECRSMLDHAVIWGLSPEDRARGVVPGATIYDLKIADDASPARSTRTAYNLGYDLQAEAYTRALSALYPLLGGRIEFRFLFVEPRRPYAIWDPRPDGGFRQLGARRWGGAVRAWGRGLATGKWADYRTEMTTEIAASMWALREEGIETDVE